MSQREISCEEASIHPKSLTIYSLMFKYFEATVKEKVNVQIPKDLF